jgi:hypothetical protein
MLTLHEAAACSLQSLNPVQSSSQQAACCNGRFFRGTDNAGKSNENAQVLGSPERPQQAYGMGYIEAEVLCSTSAQVGSMPATESASELYNLDDSTPVRRAWSRGLTVGSNILERAKSSLSPPSENQELSLQAKDGQFPLANKAENS